MIIVQFKHKKNSSEEIRKEENKKVKPWKISSVCPYWVTLRRTMGYSET
jgi:iron only hydrogenase large subunit-like protein